MASSDSVSYPKASTISIVLTSSEIIAPNKGKSCNSINTAESQKIVFNFIVFSCYGFSNKAKNIYPVLL
jgi:hypothetical protein